MYHFTLAPLILFYAAFAALILPNVGWLHPTERFASLTAQLPDSLACFVKVCVQSDSLLDYVSTLLSL